MAKRLKTMGVGHVYRGRLGVRAGWDVARSVAVGLRRGLVGGGRVRVARDGRGPREGTVPSANCRRRSASRWGSSESSRCRTSWSERSTRAAGI